MQSQYASDSAIWLFRHPLTKQIDHIFLRFQIKTADIKNNLFFPMRAGHRMVGIPGPEPSFSPDSAPYDN